MATITSIAGSDNISTSDTVINTNFTNLNSDKIETSVLDTDTALAANSDAKIPSQKAVKAYIDTSGGANASETVRGIVEEATDAEVTAGTASGATGAKLFVSPAKLATRLSGGTNPVIRKYEQAGSPATWTKPAGLKYVIAESIGAGGGGGGGSNSGTDDVSGGGGGGGGYSRKLIAAASLGTTETVTTGAGGAGASGAGTGTTGGTSSFGSHCSSAGGVGGVGGGTGGAGGAGASGDINSNGGAGGPAAGRDLGIDGIGGSGGPSYFGGSGAGGTTGNGSSGGSYGGGGGGAGGLNLGGDATGGTGGNGVVIVTEYYS